MMQLAAEIRWTKGLQKGRVMLAVAAVTATVLAVAIAGANLVSDELPPPLDHAIPALAIFEKNPYKALYYYEADKQERYEAYQAANETLSPEDVVWRVNAGLDGEFYAAIQSVTDTEAMPLLVNKYYQLPVDYVPADLTKLPSGKPATKDTCAAYKEMAGDARKEGLSLYAASAYRSYALQNRLYQGYLQQEGGNVA